MDGSTISSHATIIALTNALAAVSALDEENRSIPSIVELSARLDYLLWVVEQTDPNLLSRQELDSLSGQAQNLTSYVNSITSNPAGQASAAGQQLDAYFSRFPYPRFRKIPRAESQRIIEFVQAKADEAITKIERKSEITNRELDNLIKSISDNIESSEKINGSIESLDERQNKLSKDVDTFYERATASLEAKIDERLTEANSRLTSSIDEFQSKITDDRSKATAQLSQISADRKSTLENSERLLQDGLKKISSQGTDYLNKIREIYGIVGGEASSGQLIVSANGESTAYKVLGGVAFLAFLSGSFFAYTAIQPALLSGVDWHILVGRIGLVVASYIPAWFLSSLATKHRQAELAYRSLAVRVAAFDPYLSEFEAADRIGVKKQLAEMFFAPLLQKQPTDGLRINDLKDFERLIAPIESILERVRTIATRT